MSTPTGLCGCGCGQPTSVAKRNDARHGYIKGKPVRYLPGHSKIRRVIHNSVRHLPNGVTVIEVIYKGEKLEFLLDTADYPLVSAYKWNAYKSPHTFYATTRAPMSADKVEKRLSMHGLLFPDAEEVDHRDGSGLNNRRNNLRPCTRSQNSANSRKKDNCSSTYKGVHRYKICKKAFAASIRVNHKPIYLGYFTNEENAARAYNEAAKKYFGEFARLNEVSEVSGSKELLKAA